MNKPPPSDPTVAYYDQNAAAFSQGAEAADLSHLYAEFLPLVRSGGHILEAGCGSGRDALHFKQQGFAVTAFDASRELAAIACRALGQPVQVMTFQELDAVAAFDGIWACASLLHVPSHELDTVTSRLARALKTGAPLYASFKYGNTEGQRGDRFFNDYDETKLAALLSRHPDLILKKVWQTHDARPGREHELWLNAIFIKR